MSKGQVRRKRIFDKYVGQLKIIKENKLLADFEEYEEGIYICPICLNNFSEKDLDDNSENMLTLEDAPPKSLGGNANTLTCKNCNNKCGHDIDFHLTERHIELDIKSFLPNVRSNAKLRHNGELVNGEVNVDSKGDITITHDIRYNNPENLDKYIKTTGEKDIVDLEFGQSRVDMHRLEVALLKTAYLLAFECYGYLLILNKSYDIVREQLKNPDLDIYPKVLGTNLRSFKKEQEGVYLIKSKDFEGFYAIFSLKTKFSENRKGVYLPISDEITEQIIPRLKEQKNGFGLSLVSLSTNDYFGDIENMRLMANYLVIKSNI
jgi:hypothetical protein